MLRVPSSTVSSRLRNSRLSQILTARAVALRFPADAHALGVVAGIAEGRGAAGADPFVAALVPPLLLGEALAQGLHQLVPAAQRFDELLLLLGQVALAELLQPFLGQFGLRVARGFDALEALPEDPVEPVKVALVLDQRGARQKVEFVDVERARPRACIASSRVRNSRSEAGTLAARSSRKKEMNIRRFDPERLSNSL